MQVTCSRSAAYALTSTGVLPTVRVGRAVRVPESALDAFIHGGGARIIPKAATKPPKARRAS